MIVENTLEKGISVKNILVKRIEKIRKELVNMVNNANKDLKKTEILRKSQELDKLINKYNARLN